MPWHCSWNSRADENWRVVMPRQARADRSVAAGAAMMTVAASADRVLQ